MEILEHVNPDKVVVSVGFAEESALARVGKVDKGDKLLDEQGDGICWGHHSKEDHP